MPLTNSFQAKEPLILGVLFVIDWLSKEAISYFHVVWRLNIFQIHISYNENGIFSLPISLPIAKFLSICALILIVFSYFIVNREKAKIGFIAILIGGLSNCFDRYYRGGVLDIFHIGSFSFNIADLIIMYGSILVLASLIKTWGQSDKMVIE